MRTRTELINQPNASSYHKEQNEQLKRSFILYGDAATPSAPSTLTYVEAQGTLSGKLINASRAEQMTMTKEKVIHASATNKVDAVYENGAFSRMVWTTTADNIRQAIREGLVPNPKAIPNPLTQMIVQAGLYKRTTRERHENGVISRLEANKLNIVDTTQDCLEALQSLHTCINNYDEGIDELENLKKIQDELKTLKQQYDTTARGLDRSNEPGKTLGLSLDKLIEKVVGYESALSNLQASGNAEQIRAMLLPYGELKAYGYKENTSLQHFLQSQLNTISKSAIDANDRIDWTGGTLQEYLSGMQKMSEEFSSENIDYKNPYTQEHCGIYTAQEKNGLVAIDTRNSLGISPSYNADANEIAATLAKIDTKKTLKTEQHLEGGEPLKTEAHGHAKPQVGVPNWGFAFNDSGWRKFANVAIYPFAAIGDSLWNAAVNSAGLFADIGSAFVRGAKRLRGEKDSDPYPSVRWEKYKISPDGVSGFKDMFSREKPGEDEGSKRLTMGQTLKNATLSMAGFFSKRMESYKTHPNNPSSTAEGTPIHGVQKTSIVQSIMDAIGKGFNAVFVAPVKGIAKGFSLTIDASVNIYRDFTIGTRHISDKEVLLMLEKNINENKANNTINAIESKELVADFNKLNQTNIDYQRQQIALFLKSMDGPGAASITHAMTPDAPEEGFSWFAGEFLKDITEVFSHEILRSNRAAGAAFLVGVGAAAPMMVGALATNAALNWVNASIAKAFVGETLVAGESASMMATLSVGLIQGKLLFLAANIFEGRESMLAKGFTAVLENPVIAGVVGLAAVELGVLIAKGSLPMISSEAANIEANATIPQFELALTGAKIAAIVVEGLFNLKGHGHKEIEANQLDSAIANQRPRIKEIISEMMVGKPETEINEAVEKYCNAMKGQFSTAEMQAKLGKLSNTIDTTIASLKDGRPTLNTTRREEVRNKILEINPDTLSSKDKYLLLAKVKQDYKDDPEYVRSVAHMLNLEKKSGPLGESLKILLSYPGKLIRAVAAGVGGAIYAIPARYYATRDSEKSIEYAHKRDNLFEIVKDVGKEAFQDTGILVKNILSGVRTIGGLAAAVTATAGTIIASPFIVASKAFSWFSNKVFKTDISPLTFTGFFSKLNEQLRKPGIFSRIIDSIIGVFRSGANAKGIHLATEDVDKKEKFRPMQGPSDEREQNIDKLAEQILARAIGEDISKLKSFDSIMRRLEVNLSDANLSTSERKEIKQALIELDNAVALGSGKDAYKKPYLDKINDLVQIADRNLTKEFNDSYKKLREFKLSSFGSLDNIDELKRLKELHSKLKNSKEFLNNHIKTNRNMDEQTLIQAFKTHDGLSIHGAKRYRDEVRALYDQIKEDIPKEHKSAVKNIVEQLIEGFDVACTAATETNSRLSRDVFTEVQKVLIGPSVVAAPKTRVEAADNTPLPPFPTEAQQEADAVALNGSPPPFPTEAQQGADAIAAAKKATTAPAFNKFNPEEEPFFPPPPPSPGQPAPVSKQPEVVAPASPEQPAPAPEVIPVAASTAAPTPSQLVAASSKQAEVGSFYFNKDTKSFVKGEASPEKAAAGTLRVEQDDKQMKITVTSWPEDKMGKAAFAMATVNKYLNDRGLDDKSPAQITINPKKVEEAAYLKAAFDDLKIGVKFTNEEVYKSNSTCFMKVQSACMKETLFNPPEPEPVMEVEIDDELAAGFERDGEQAGSRMSA